MPESANRRYLILAICCLSLFIVGIDNTAVNVALPSIQRDLKAPVSGLQWTIDAYTLTLASGLILAGSLGDRFGRRRVFMTGTSLFVVGSVLCAVSPNLGALVGSRAVQGVGGAMMNPVAMSIITNVFTDAKDRAKAIGMWSAAFGVSMALGPVVGGLLLSATSWRSIFWVNVPIGVAAVVLTGVFVPESKAPTARRFDPVGQALGIAFLAGVTYAIIEAPRVGWMSGRTIAVFAVAIAAAAGFVAYELRREQPLIDPRFFRSLPFSGATLMAISGFLALSGFLFMNTLYLQDALGYSALKAGLLTLPIAVASVIVGPRSGRWVANHGPRAPLIAAGVLLAVSALMLTGLSATTPTLLLLAAYAVLGLGFGTLNPPITNTAVSGMPRAQAGVAAAVASTSRQVGQTLGVAIIGSVVVARATGPARTGLPAASHAGWWILFGCGLAVFVLGMLTTGKRAAATAARTARLTEPPEPTEPTTEPWDPRTAMSDYPSNDAYRAHAAMQHLVLRQRDVRSAVERATGVSFGRSRALRRLVHGPLRMSELAARLQWDKPYTTTVIDDLEQRGFVTRNVAPDDRRAKMVELTPEGHTVAVQAIQLLAEPAPGLSRLNAEELAVVADLLEKAAAETEC